MRIINEPTAAAIACECVVCVVERACVSTRQQADGRAHLGIF